MEYADNQPTTADYAYAAAQDMQRSWHQRITALEARLEELEAKVNDLSKKGNK